MLVTLHAPAGHALLVALALAACGGSSDGPADAAPGVDALRAVDAPAGFPTTCTGACAVTDLTAALAMTRHLDRAYYGVTKTATSATLHVEISRGGAAGCPTQASPTPDYTLVLGSVPIPTSAAVSTSPGNVLDYVGDLLGGPLGAAATAVMLTPVAANVCTSCVGMPAPSHAAGIVAFDVALTFATGTVHGHLGATHCDSLDATQ